MMAYAHSGDFLMALSRRRVRARNGRLPDFGRARAEPGADGQRVISRPACRGISIFRRR